MRHVPMILIVLFAAFASPAFPAPAPVRELPAGAVKLSGKVTVTKREEYDGPGKGLPGPLSWRSVRAAELQTKDGVYRIVMDEKGRDFARTMNRETAEMFGLVSEKGGARWVRLVAYADPALESAHELWRRMRCNACAVGPARVNARPPKDLRGAKAVAGRHYPYKDAVVDWSRDDRFLWVATDNSVSQVALKDRSVARTYDRRAGLPAPAVTQVHSDGVSLWIVHRAGVARLRIGGERIEDLPGLRCRYARMCSGDKTVWIVSDRGTWIFGKAGGAPRKAPALPTAGRIGRQVAEGIWRPDWKRKTKHFMSSCLAMEDRLFVVSYGALYGLESGAWRRIADTAWEPRVHGGKLWFLGTRGVGEYDPASGGVRVHVPPGVAGVRLACLLLTKRGAWVAGEPAEEAARRARPESALGLGRLDFATGKWQVWKEAGGARADHVSALAAGDGAVWALAREGDYRVKAAHPGMTYVKRKTFEASGFALLRCVEGGGDWQRVPLAAGGLERRVICGQDGSRGMDEIAPQTVRAMTVGERRFVGWTRLFARKYFSGYWPCVNTLALRKGTGALPAAAFEHRPASLGLQGEQPEVLNISNKGEMVLEAVGHDNVLGLFLHGGRHWAVTEGGAACLDEGEGRWRRVVETGFRFYWRATAAFDDGKALYVGSDRGVVSRLDVATGRFTVLTVLKDRAVSGFARDGAGNLVVRSVPATLGRLPVQLRNAPALTGAEAAVFDGKAWKAVSAKDTPPAPGPPQWFFRRVEKRHNKDKSRGNFLLGSVPGGKDPKPRFYVKEVFFPVFLCAGRDGRLWIGTFSGLVRLDVK